MSEEKQQDKFDKETTAAKKRLDDAVTDLTKASSGTNFAPMMTIQLLIIQLDTALDLLANAGLLDRKALFNRVAESVENMATECRRAVLSAGGASALAGLRGPKGH
jgi:hypothetical protein